MTLGADGSLLGWKAASSIRRFVVDSIDTTAPATCFMAFCYSVIESMPVREASILQCNGSLKLSALGARGTSPVSRRPELS